MTQEKYFFCYSTNLMDFLRYEKGIKFICTAFHDQTNKRFWLFERTEQVADALKEYNKRGKDLGLHNR
ncbi:hypothetical protein J7J00_17780 [Bacillus sp. ISL-4]|uniref:DUF5659 domain-containing protein n=1 Tax=Bacillus sp. ISL-4 TaxID=2819125 RepID=UPI001BECACB4|nr:DUF5659 domain-containing protein [Bacillus sp. ISL-4]MBT2667330.1 hypothetical protein [Bacillus sp. ISL-4]MBT2669434.1 hypothetical protein [Streptomyces sp. ISL-14]